MKKLSSLLLATTCGLLTQDIVNAQPAVEWTGGATVSKPAYIVGWRFQVSSASDIEVRALGNVETGARVEIWSVPSGYSLVSADIPAGSWSEGHFHYVNIDPFRLVKNTEYVIGSRLTNGISQDTLYWVDGFTNSAEIIFLGPRWSNVNYPGFDWLERNPGFFGPNFMMTNVPSISHASIRFSEVEISWTSESNKTYQIQYKSALTTNAWLNLSDVIQGSGTNNFYSNAIPAAEPQRFYRVLALPSTNVVNPIK